MKRSLSQCLLHSGVVAILSGCVSAYSSLKPVGTDRACAEKIAPLRIATSWYSATVDIANRHLSGLVLIKQLPNRTERIVFTSETGVTLFDFGFGPDGKFSVYSIISKLNRKPVINTLRKDFALLFGLPFANHSYKSWSSGREIFFGALEKNETAYFISSKDCGSLLRLELGSRRKKKVTIQLTGAQYTSPDSIVIKHHNFPFTILLTHFRKNEADK